MQTKIREIAQQIMWNSWQKQIYATRTFRLLAFNNNTPCLKVVPLIFQFLGLYNDQSVNSCKNQVMQGSSCSNAQKNDSNRQEDTDKQTQLQTNRQTENNMICVLWSRHKEDKYTYIQKVFSNAHFSVALANSNECKVHNAIHCLSANTPQKQLQRKLDAYRTAKPDERDNSLPLISSSGLFSFLVLPNSVKINERGTCYFIH